MSNHVIAMAFDVQADSREQAIDQLLDRLSRSGVVRDPVESFWTMAAGDKRFDGNDNASYLLVRTTEIDEKIDRGGPADGFVENPGPTLAKALNDQLRELD